MTGAWRGTERLGRCIEAMLPKPSQPRSVQHRWALRQATQRPPGIYSGLKSSQTVLINECPGTRSLQRFPHIWHVDLEAIPLEGMGTDTDVRGAQTYVQGRRVTSFAAA